MLAPFWYRLSSSLPSLVRSVPVTRWLRASSGVFAMRGSITARGRRSPPSAINAESSGRTRTANEIMVRPSGHCRDGASPNSSVPVLPVGGVLPAPRGDVLARLRAPAGPPRAGVAGEHLEVGPRGARLDEVVGLLGLAAVLPLARLDHVDLPAARLQRAQRSPHAEEDQLRDVAEVEPDAPP